MNITLRIVFGLLVGLLVVAVAGEVGLLAYVGGGYAIAAGVALVALSFVPLLWTGGERMPGSGYTSPRFWAFFLSFLCGIGVAISSLSGDMNDLRLAAGWFGGLLAAGALAPQVFRSVGAGRAAWGWRGAVVVLLAGLVGTIGFVLREHQSGRVLCVRVAPNFGGPGLDFTVHALADPDPAVADVAERTLSNTKARPEAVVPRLFAFGLNEADDAAVERVCSLLEPLDREAPSTLRRLRAFEFDRYVADPLERLNLGHLLVPFVQAHLDELSSRQRDAACEMLAYAGKTEAVVSVRVKMLQERPGEDDFWRTKACRELGDLGPAAREAAPRLRELLSDPSPAVADAARRALGAIDPP